MTWTTEEQLLRLRMVERTLMYRRSPRALRSYPETSKRQPHRRNRVPRGGRWRFAVLKGRKSQRESLLRQA